MGRLRIVAAKRGACTATTIAFEPQFSMELNLDVASPPLASRPTTDLRSFTVFAGIKRVYLSIDGWLVAASLGFGEMNTSA